MGAATPRIRRLVVAGVLASLCASFVTEVVVAAAVSATRRVDGPPPSPADPARPITDPALIASIGTAIADRPARSERIPVVGVEVLTAYTAEVARTVGALGGVVVGVVDGQVVESKMPASAVDDLALSDGVEFVRSPLSVSHPMTDPSTTSRTDAGPGLGPTVGESVGLTNASSWQGAGFMGAVKVGIIDYFNLGLWKPSEAGPVPDAAHRFCLDTSDDADDVCSGSHTSGTNNHDGYEHGVAVAEVLKDIAPNAELYLASASTVTDLQAAIDFFATNGVHIVTRSLGAAFDGPGDGTGPLDSVVDYAASRAITWFNSAGNDAIWGYARVAVPDDLSATNGYIDFDSGPGVDTLLRISSQCVLFNGVRWSDWGRAPADRTDYSVELLAPTSNPDVGGHDENINPSSFVSIGSADTDQSAGAPPLEIADGFACAGNTYGSDGGIMYLRIRRKPGTPVVGEPDTLEVGVGEGFLETGRWQAAYSADKPVVDSRNPALVAVGAVDPPNGNGNPEAIGPYSSQGPTNDGRIKPDVSAPSCLANSIYAPSCFSGTSAASPAAAGAAALLLDAGVAIVGAPLAAAVKHFAFDRPFVSGGPLDGADNKYGTGQIQLPTPPQGRIGSVPTVPTPSAYHQVVPTRIIDTRPSSPVGLTAGPQPENGIIDIAITSVGVPPTATAVAINLTSTDSLVAGFVQAIPYLRSAYGTSSTLNVPGPRATKANFAIVPIGAEGKISVYLVPGGNLIVDVLGYFAPSAAPVAAGRFVAIDPVRTLDTRTSNLVPAGWTPHKPANESVVVPSSSAVPAGVAALVLNVTATEAAVDGFLRAHATGTTPTSSTVNYSAGVDASNTVIVPVAADGTVSVYTNAAAHIVVDVTGYITGASAPAASTGLFVPVVTARAFDSRATGGPFGIGSLHAVQLSGLGAPLPVVPALGLALASGASVSAISINLTAADETGAGYLSAFPAGGNTPATSSLNYTAGQPVANGVMVKLSASGSLSIYANTQSNVIVDVNGYFT
jgi:Subtilase family